jgi:hypothetical protein
MKNTKWEETKHIVISFINDFYSTGNEIVKDKNLNEILFKFKKDIEKKICSNL